MLQVSQRRGQGVKRPLITRAHDMVGSIEAAYDVDSDDDQWVQGLLRSIHPALHQGCGAIALFYDGGSGERVQLWGGGGYGVSDAMLDGLVPLVNGLDPAELQLMYLRCPRIMASASEIMGTQRAREYAAQVGTDKMGYSDTVGIKCHEPEGWGLMLGVAVPFLTYVDPKTEQTWSRLAAHVTAALRIRRRLQAATAVVPPDAVLTSGGAISHAETAAQDARARALLSAAVRARETARGPLRRANSEEAAGLWQALVDGRWTLMDQHDSDGRRWILARGNAPATRGATALTARERQVLAYVALGQANKLVAYTLGLTVAAVGNLIARAARKLGARNRAELIRQLAKPKNGETDGEP